MIKKYGIMKIVLICISVSIVLILVSGAVVYNVSKQKNYLEEQDALINEDTNTNKNNGTENVTPKEDKTEEEPAMNEVVTPVPQVKPTIPVVKNPITTLDKILPVVSIDVNGTNGYVKKVDVNISATDNLAISKIKYAISNSNSVRPVDYTTVDSTNATISFPLAGNNGVYYIWYYAVDIIGNTSNVKVTNAFKIDNTIPTSVLNINSTVTYVKSANVVINALDSVSPISKIMYKVVSVSTPDEPSIYDEATNVSSVTVSIPSINGEYYLWYYVVDSVGNKSTPTRSTGTYKINNTVPVVSIDKSGTDSYVNSVEAVITASDDLAVSKIMYKAVPLSNPAEPSVYNEAINTSSVTVSFPANGNNGQYYIWYYAVDNSGNASVPVRTTNTFKIDNTLPIANINKQNTSTYVQSVDVTITATDSVSSISKIMYKAVPLSNPAEPSVYDEATNTSSVIVNFPAAGDNEEYYIWYYVVDSAGNASIPVRTTGTFKIDNAGPNISIDNDGTVSYVQTASATIQANDMSGISKIMYKVVPVTSPDEPSVYDESNTSSVTVNFPDAGNNNQYYIWYYAIDGLNNASVPVRTTDTFKIDNETPTASIDSQGTSVYVKTASVVITGNDASGISKIMYKAVPLSSPAEPSVYDEAINTSSVTVNFPDAGNNDQYYIWYYVIDNSGNSSVPVRTTNTFKIDNIAPALDLVGFPIGISTRFYFNNDGSKHIDIEGLEETATNEPIDNINLRVFLEVKDDQGNMIAPAHQLTWMPSPFFPLPGFYNMHRSNVVYTPGTRALITLWVEDIAGNRTYIFFEQFKIL